MDTCILALLVMIPIVGIFLALCLMASLAEHFIEEE